MQTRIVGTTMPILEVTLSTGEVIIAEGGDVAWLSTGFGMETSTRFGSGGQGGFLSGLKRMLGGGQLFLTEYTAPNPGGFVAFAAQLPGVIRELAIDPADNYMIQSGSYMASTRDVEVSVGRCRRSSAPASSVAPVWCSRSWPATGRPGCSSPGNSSSTTCRRGSPYSFIPDTWRCSARRCRWSSPP